MTTSRRPGRWLPWLGSTILLLNACRQGEQLDALRAWIRQTQDSAHQSVSVTDALLPLNAILAEQELQEFQPFPYLINASATPFGDGPAAGRTDPAADTDPRPPQRGTQQALENFPLTSMRMVGSLARGANRHALITVAGTLYRVQIGDYLGQQFGMVQRITESALELQELVYDSDGAWVERHALLAMEGRAQ